MQVDRLDRLVPTVVDVEATIGFYERVLGMRAVRFGAGRRALAFGRSKINLHPAAEPLRPHAGQPTPGSADLRFIVAAPPAEVLEHLRARGVAVEQGPVPRTGALGPIESVSCRDPDGNLIEVSSCARSSGVGVADPAA